MRKNTPRGDMTEEEREDARAASRARYAAKTPEERRATYGRSYEAQAEKRRQYAREAGQRLRQDMLDAYGRFCRCCGETHEEFLALEHVNGDGAADRAESGRTNQDVLRRLKREGWPRDGRYTVLCWNCNCARGRYGYCPHERRTLELIIGA